MQSNFNGSNNFGTVETRAWEFVLVISSSTHGELIMAPGQEANGNNLEIQSNFNSSNTDGSFAMANSNPVLSPYKILRIGQENKYLGKFLCFIKKLYVENTH